MGTLHYLVKIRHDDQTGEMRPVESTHCPFKNGLTNICVGANGKACTHMLENPAAKQLTERYYLMNCGFK